MSRFARVLFVLLALLAGCAVTTNNGAPDAAGAELLETHWRPVEIDGKPLTIQPGTREPHIVLTREGRVSGNTGCNSLGGAYRQSVDGLRFEKLVMTRRACVPEAGNVLESSFTKALDETVSYRIVRETLELRDVAGVTRMRLEARSQR